METVDTRRQLRISQRRENNVAKMDVTPLRGEVLVYYTELFTQHDGWHSSKFCIKFISHVKENTVCVHKKNRLTDVD